MTERLYYHDCTVREFDAQVVATEANKVYLDRTAFYPTSGGQPNDRGKLGGATVVDVIDEGDRIAHVVEGELPSGTVKGEVDWSRRWDYTQQHTGQHLLSAVFIEACGLETIAVHFGEEISTIELATPSVSAAQIERAVERANAVVFENRPVKIVFASAGDDLGLRRASEREGELRIVDIDGLDRSACGGTHVRFTGEIGPILVRKQEKIRGNTRLEFVCGMRAVRRAGADYEALAAAARAMSAQFEEVPALVKSTLEKVQELDKSRRKVAMELAQLQGRELYHGAAPDAAGLRKLVLREAITEDTRTRATAFASQPMAVLVVISENPPSVLVAASKDSGVNAGNLVKQAVTANGGRGGGSPQMAQGSVPDAEALQRVVTALA